MYYTINIKDGDLLRKLKVHCVQNKISIIDVVEQSILNYLKDNNVEE